MDKHECKYENTDKKLRHAFLILLGKYDFDRVTVTKISKQAGIDRSTFYAHYSNVYELADSVQNHLIDLFVKEISEKSALSVKSIDRVRRPDELLIDKDIIFEYLAFIKKYRAVFLIVIKNHEYLDFAAGTDAFKLKFIYPALEIYGVEDETEKEYLFEFLWGGLNSILLKWLRTNCADPIEKVCDAIAFGFANKQTGTNH